LEKSVQNVTLKQLRALVATIESGAVARAAERLHVTPPAVSQQLRLLERATRLTLVERGRKGLRPTDAGREVLASTALIEAELARCSRALDAIASGSGGRVSFGAVSTAKYVAPQILASFWKQHPDVEVSIAIGNRAETVALLERGEVDLVMMGRPPAELDLQTAAIAENPHVVIASRDHPLATRRSIEVEELLHHRLLVREPGSGTRQVFEELFSRNQLSPPMGLEMSSNETIKQSAMAGLGVALISAHTIVAEVNDGRLAILDVQGCPIVRQWQVVRPATRRFLPPADALWEFFVSHGAEHFPSFSLPQPRLRGTREQTGPGPAAARDRPRSRRT
jgi:DNA-binding transcriptional LysR family regulator